MRKGWGKAEGSADAVEGIGAEVQSRAFATT